jgi:hypothetical protein
MRAELAVFRYAFGRLKPDVPPGAVAFTIHRTSGASALFFVMAALTPVEALVMYWLLPETLAWIVAVLSLYSAIWMIAIGRSFDALPILVDSGGITLRRGLLANLRVPRTAIRAVFRNRAPEGKSTRFAVLADPCLVIEFHQPLQVELPLGIRRQTLSASLAPDDAEGFLKALKANFDLAE